MSAKQKTFPNTDHSWLVFDRLHYSFKSAQNSSADLQKKQESLKAHVRLVKKTDLTTVYSVVPSFFHRSWIRTSLNGHKSETRKALKYLRLNNTKKVNSSLKQAELWLGQASQIYERTATLRNLTRKNLSTQTVHPANLAKGDLVLSYKTSSYMKKSLVSRLVKRASNSSITHVMIACHDTNETPALLSSSDETSGLGLIAPNPRLGEILLILKPKNEDTRTAILPAIEAWKEIANERTAHKGTKDDWGFPELKCQAASFVGLVTVMLSYFGQPLTPRNPIKTKKVFCSELIDTIFKQSGFFIGPRSIHDAIVGPVEFFYSPLFVLTGVIANPIDIDEIENEIKIQFS